MAVFRTDLQGKTRVFVLEREVSMVKVEPTRRAPGPFKIVAEGGKKLDIPFPLWGEMHNLILDVGNAVKRHKVTGKSLKFERINRR